MSNIGLKNIRDYTGNFGDENQILGTEYDTQSSEYKIKWVDGSGIGGLSNTSVEPFNISQSTLEDFDNNQHYIYSSFIAVNENPSTLKLYINSESILSLDKTNKIFVRIIDSSNVVYMSGNINITQSDVNSIININLISTSLLTVNNKYLLGIYKEIENPYNSGTSTGDKVRLYNNPFKNALNGLFKLTDKNHYNVTIYDASDTNNIIDNTQNIKYYWYKLE